MPDQERLYYLFDKYIAETATPEELNELKSLLNDQSYEDFARNRLVNLLRQTEPISGHSESRWQAILQEIRAEAPAKSRRIPALVRWSAVAALLLGGLTAVWLLHQKSSTTPIAAATPIKHDRAPGGNLARLTLSDGSIITLDSAQNGTLAQQGNTKITKLADGQLAYKTLDEKPVAPVSNTLSTPRGGQYRLVLPDGSNVWLNAASSITYPTAFTGAERTVSITGEAYFEVAPDPSMPFKVAVNAPIGEQQIEVLGTHFDVKAYGDENAIATTLFEGLVRLSAKDATTKLLPGQQGLQHSDGAIRLNPHADLEAAIAWKNGLFHFEHADIHDVMRQIARWYDVAVVFEGAVPNEQFDGEILRNSNLTEVLKILQLSNVHFKIEDKKVTVTP